MLQNFKSTHVDRQRGKYPLSELCTHSYGLADVGLAIQTVAGDSVPGSIHVSVLPWSET